MFACGLDINHNGAANLVILDQSGDVVAHTTTLQPPLEAATAARWIRATAQKFAPEPLWIAVADIKWHWIDTLGTLPVRWIHYLSEALSAHMPNSDEFPDSVSRYAVGLARALNADLKDLRLYHEEMFYLSFLRDCAQKLTEIIPRMRRFHPFLRSQLATPLPEDDQVPF